jgi:hypothetical protein
VEVEAAQGTFVGQLAQRAYVIELPATEPATSARIDGVSTTSSYDAGALLNRVQVPARAIQQGVTVTMVAKQVGDSALREQAFTARTGASGPTFAAKVESAFRASESQGEKLAVLAAAGVGAFAKNEQLYGYPNRPRFVRYERAPVAAQVELADLWLGGVQKAERATLTFAGERIVSSLAAVEIDFDRERVDLAPLASASFSSEETASTIGIADRKVGGYPGERAEEWSTAGEKTGASVRLTWSAPQRVARVLLYDRINTNDQVTSGTLRFSDGSELDVAAVPNTPEGGPLVLDFAARDVTWVELSVTGVSATTENIGLAELAVYGE